MIEDMYLFLLSLSLLSFLSFFLHSFFLFFCLPFSFTWCHLVRLLFLEEHHNGLLVHAVPVRDVHQVRPRAWADADPDPRQPQGGTGLWVCLQHARLWRQKADPLHRVHAHQGDVLHTLEGWGTRLSSSSGVSPGDLLSLVGVCLGTFSNFPTFEILHTTFSGGEKKDFFS